MSLSSLRIPLFLSWIPFTTFGPVAPRAEPAPLTHGVGPTEPLIRDVPREAPKERELLDANGIPVGLVHEADVAATARPLVIGVHGANSRPLWICENLRKALGPEPFVVCPHPSSHLDRDASWGTGGAISGAVDRAVQAAIETYGDRVDADRIVYFGHSLGAMMIPAAYAQTRPRLPFSAVVVFEGMPKETKYLERAVRNMGATQALFVSGQGGWQGKHAAAAASMARHGVFAWHVAGTFGHSFVGEAFDIVRREVAVLLYPAG